MEESYGVKTVTDTNNRKDYKSVLFFCNNLLLIMFMFI